MLYRGENLGKVTYAKTDLDEPILGLGQEGMASLPTSRSFDLQISSYTHGTHLSPPSISSQLSRQSWTRLQFAPRRSAWPP